MVHLLEMFETPSSTADFDFGSFNPASLKARFRSAFKGFKPSSSCPAKAADFDSPSEFTPASKHSDASSTSAYPNSDASSLRGSSGAPPRKMPKDVEVALQFFNEVLRTDKTEMLIGSVNEIFESVISLIARLKIKSSAIQDALFAFLDWSVAKLQQEILKLTEQDRTEGRNLASSLSKRILEHDDSLSVVKANHTFQNSGRQSPIASTDSGFGTDFGGDSSASNRLSVHPASTSSALENQQTIDDLLMQLNLRQVEQFKPVFPTVLNDDSDEDDNSITVDEQREEREEKKDTKTCEEEIQRLPDGREVHMKKTRTYNMKQSSKHVTIRTRGGGQDEKIQKFDDGDMTFNDDVDTDFFTPPRSRLWGRHHRGFDDSFEDNTEDNMGTFEAPPENATSQKVKKVEHSNAVTQSVAKTEKRNGRIVSDNAAHKLDTCELKAKQIENYEGDKLLNRRGDGFYEEQSIVRPGLPASSSSIPSEAAVDPILPKKRHVVEYMQTFGSENEERDDFFKASTLASYVVLNDNLRFHEEQYKKNVQFKYSVTGPPTAPPEFSKLGQVLQCTDFEQIRLPKRFLDEDEGYDGQKEITYINRLSIAGPQTVLESTDVRDWLVLRVKDGTTSNEVRGGPADALIAFATQPAGSLLYQEAFLTTYRTFVPSYDLIQKLIKRYNYMTAVEDATAVKVARQCFSVIVRVVDELCCIELSKELISAVNKFIYCLIRDGNYTFAKLLRKRLMTRFEQKANVRKPLIYDVPANVKNKQSSLFEFRSSAIAKQMSLLDADLFQRIEPAEMLWWAQEQDEKKSPNLCAFTEHFNKVSYWVRTMVIRPKEQRARDKYLVKFIKIMKQLRSMGNYNAYLAVLSALESGPVRRLDWPKNCVDMLKEHAGIMDSTLSFKNYRTLLAESRPPCLPYLGLVLQDLTFVHIGNPDCLSPKQCQGKKNLLNYGKRWQQFTILDSIRRFKSWNYSIERDDRILQFFGGFKDYLAEDDIWELSESIKPRSRKSK